MIIKEKLSNIDKQILKKYFLNYTDLKPVLNQDFEFNFDEIYKFILNYKK